MLEELRLNPCAPAARSGGRCLGLRADTDGGVGYTRLCTAFACSRRRRSTGAPRHDVWCGRVGVSAKSPPKARASRDPEEEVG
jgi:hypothetical protein